MGRSSGYGQHLPGYKGYNTIHIHYSIPGGVQGPEHPNPGQPFSGTSRTTFLPDTHEGREVLKVNYLNVGMPSWIIVAFASS